MEDSHIRKPWYTQSLEEVYKELNTSEEGLSDAEASLRLKSTARTNCAKRKSAVCCKCCGNN